jgi:putative DNA methylase
MESVAGQAKPIWRPDIEMPKKHRNFQPPGYGMTSFGDLFTSRQLVALETFSELVQKAHKRVESDAISAGVHGDERSLNAAGNGANAYGEAVEMYLGFALSKAVDRNSSLCVWESSMDRMRGTFGRQALPMTWDYVETNPFAGAGGDIYGTAHSLCEVLDQMTTSLVGYVTQADACTQTLSVGKVVSTDPPYYDNICYADLSDFFYVWLRPSLRPIFPELFGTVAVPKGEELVASPARHGGAEQANTFFLDGMTRAMNKLAVNAHPAFPITIYYAFKQSETEKVLHLRAGRRFLKH